MNEQYFDDYIGENVCTCTTYIEMIAMIVLFSLVTGMIEERF